MARGWGREDGEKPYGETVLVVDDDPDVLEVTVERLELLGYAVVQAVDGPSALRALSTAPRVDILLSDMVMPSGMNGVELAKAARGLRPELRVVLASAYPRSALSAEHGLTGEFTFLAKPYTLDMLAQGLRAAPSPKAGGFR